MDWILARGPAWLTLFGFFAAAFSAGATGGLFKPGAWYRTLSKPAWTPPNWLFPIAWSILYVAMSVAVWWVSLSGSPWALPAVALWSWQIVMNALWSPVFFGLRRLDAAFGVMIGLSTSVVATTAILALVKIGKPSVGRAVKVLSESDPLVDFHKKAVMKATDSKEAPKGNPALSVAAAVIGLAGRTEGIAPLIAAMNEKGVEDADKALIARELTKIPATQESIDAFKAAFESIPLEASIQGTPALLILAEAAGDFYEPAMVDWLIDRAANTKGGGGIFLHVTNGTATAGCVAIPQSVMRDVLTWLDPDRKPVIVIGPESTIGRM